MAQPTQRVGVLLAQLGTPDAPTTPALRRYLRQFLSDPRVVERNRLAWWFILRLLVLPRKSPKSAELYRRVWTGEGSPLLVISRAQARGLETELNRRAPDRFKVVLGMRYGSPSIASAVAELREWGAERLLLLPAYPQYAGATTGSTYDEVFAALSKLRYVPALRVVPPYFDHPAYIGALATSVREAFAQGPPDKLIISFHGIPQMMVDRGDPYQSHCEATARLLASAAELERGSYVVSYQSRAGKEPWLLPNTDEVFVELAQKGARRVKVICPGFVADCLETIDEIGFVGLEQFQSGGGETLELIAGLNDRPEWISGMAEIVCEQLDGWR